MAYKVYDQRYVMIPTWIIFHHLPGEYAEITWPPSHCTCLRGAVLQDSKRVISIHILFKAVVGLNNLILVDYLFLSLVNDRYWFVSNNADIAGNLGWFAHTQMYCWVWDPRMTIHNTCIRMPMRAKMCGYVWSSWTRPYHPHFAIFDRAILQ